MQVSNLIYMATNTAWNVAKNHKALSIISALTVAYVWLSPKLPTLFPEKREEAFKLAQVGDLVTGTIALTAAAYFAENSKAAAYIPAGLAALATFASWLKL